MFEVSRNKIKSRVSRLIVIGVSLFFSACDSASELDRLNTEMRKLHSTRDDNYSLGTAEFDYQQLSSVVLANGHIRKGYDLIQLFQNGEILVYQGPLSANAPNYKRFTFKLNNGEFARLKSLLMANDASRLKLVYNADMKDSDQTTFVLKRNDDQASKFVICNGYMPDEVTEIVQVLNDLRGATVSQGTEETLTIEKALQEISVLIDP